MRLAYRFVSLLVRPFPYFTHILLAALGRLKYFLYIPDHKKVLFNQNLVRPNRGFLRSFISGSAVLAHFMHYWTDFLWFAKGGPKIVAERVKAYDGSIDMIKGILAKGRGVIMASAHIGNWEAGGMFLGANGIGLSVVALKHRDCWVNDFFVTARKRYNVETIYVGDVRRYISLIKKGGALAVLADWDFSNDNNPIPVTMFGRRIGLPRGAFLFAKKTGAPIVVSFCLRKKDLTYEYRSLAVLDPLKYDINGMAQAYANCLENVLSEYPEQWLMFGRPRFLKEALEKSDIVVVIPAYNEKESLPPLLESISALGYKAIVVDDGSEDGTFEAISSFKGVRVYRLEKNTGKGNAIKAGLAIAREMGFEWAALMDADGQHLPEEIENLCKDADSNTGLICGNRMHMPKGMPVIRWVTNYIMSLFISMFTNTWVPDSQCGFRLVRLAAVDTSRLISERYEIETELIFRVVKNGYDVKSAPITSIYTSANKSYIRPFIDTFRFLRFLLREI